MVLNKRIVLALLVFLWLLLLTVYRLPKDNDETEVVRIYREILHTLTKNDFYGHPEIMKDMWYFQPRSDQLTPLNFTFLIDSAEACENNSEPLLLVTVMSLHNMTEQRAAIRQTYGRPTKGLDWPGKVMYGDVKLLFFFGVSEIQQNNDIIHMEAQTHRDVVLVDFTESYFNLTYKVLMAIKWSERYCPGVQFLMKVDEDTFVDLPRVTNVLLSLNWTKQIYGHFHFDDQVERRGKSKVSTDAYPLSKYPPHVKGNIYVMPAELAYMIAHLAQYMPYVNMEDAHVTGNIAKMLDVRHQDIPPGQYDPHGAPKLCDFALGRKIAGQQVNASFAYKLWNAIENPSVCL